MIGRYELRKIGSFWEVFDWAEKATVYVTESHPKAVRAVKEFRRGQIPKYYGGF